ncbi:NPH3 domain [Dillenia turbinata]|uniref:NPH3 domain n=1 Tax=Dillenia turbinata TaxID=194707 RepID=A0AAN8UX55_9MAGN
MEALSPNDCSFSSSPFPSPNIGALLKIRIISWSQETGLPVTLCVRHQLYSKSGYFRKKLNESNEIELPESFPGGSETFEMIALFSYGSSTLIDPFNVAALLCAAEFLEMNEEYGSGNLCERADLYLNQVVLQSWDDTLIVLRKCQTLLPWSEELLVVSRCIESLAFMACMEILDPDRRRSQPVVTLEALVGQSWGCETVKEIVSQDLWIKDLIALPFGFFKRIIGSLRRQGMKEKYVSPIIVFYANKWVLLKKAQKFWESSSEKNEDNTDKALNILQGILDLLPTAEKASRVIPAGFYLALLARSLELGLTSASIEKLQDQIAALLHLSHVEDFLLPGSETDSLSSSVELATMERIFTIYVTNMGTKHAPSARNSLVSELWDTYLSRVALDPNLAPEKFMDLIETVPITVRLNHDHFYRALSTFFLAHQNITQEEKAMVCKHLDCQKLSQETCIEAVQNEMMPLRLIIQALFVQQLNTRQAFKECSDSFHYAHCGDFSGSLTSSRQANSKSQNLEDSPYTDGDLCSRPLSFLLQKDNAIQKSDFSRKEYESTSFRIQNLEQKHMSLKRSLEWQNLTKRTESIPAPQQNLRSYSSVGNMLSKKKNPLGQVSACIGSVNFASHRKYASRILKAFRKIALFGRGKSKRKPGAAALWPKPF